MNPEFLVAMRERLVGQTIVAVQERADTGLTLELVDGSTFELWASTHDGQPVLASTVPKPCEAGS